MTNRFANTLSAGRKAFSVLAVATVAAVALSPVAASAKGGHGHRGHYGYGAAALAGGLILGAIAANAAYDEEAPACWTEKRVRFNAYGERIVEKVRFCD